jgi:hypothetical protein
LPNLDRLNRLKGNNRDRDPANAKGDDGSEEIFSVRRITHKHKQEATD